MIISLSCLTAAATLSAQTSQRLLLLQKSITLLLMRIVSKQRSFIPSGSSTKLGNGRRKSKAVFADINTPVGKAVKVVLLAAALSALMLLCSPSSINTALSTDDASLVLSCALAVCGTIL